MARNFQARLTGLKKTVSMKLSRQGGLLIFGDFENPGNIKRYQNTAQLCSVYKTWMVKIALQVKGIFTHSVTLLRIMPSHSSP